MSELKTKALSELTTVDSLENTDTLLIESGGQMKKVSPSVISGGGSGGGGEEMIAEITAEQQSSSGTYNNVSCSMTFQDIAEAIRSGKKVIGKCCIKYNTSSPSGAVQVKMYSFGVFALYDTDVDSTMFPRGVLCRVENASTSSVKFSMSENGNMSFY